MGCTTSRHAAVANDAHSCSNPAEVPYDKSIRKGDDDMVYATSSEGEFSENSCSLSTTNQHAEIEPSSLSTVESPTSSTKPLVTDMESSRSEQQKDQQQLHDNQAPSCISDTVITASQPPLLFTKKYFRMEKCISKNGTNATFLALLQASEPSWHGGGEENRRKNSFAS